MKILNLAWKDTLLRFSDRLEILFFLILPLVFTYLLSGGAQGASFEGIPLLVVDQDGSLLSAELITALSGSDVLELQMVSNTAAEQQFAEQKAPAWLTIPAGFEDDLLAGQKGRLDLRRVPSDTRADAAERAIWTAAGEVNQALAAAQTGLEEAERLQAFGSEAERQSYFARSLVAAQAAFQAAPERVTISLPEAVSSQTYDPATQASSGQLVTWVLIPLLGTSALFAIERRQKTLARLLTTPTRKVTFLLGTITGQLLIALLQIGLLVGFGALVLKVQWGNSPAGLAVMAVSFTLAAVSLGTTLGTFVKTDKQANNLSILLGMLLALLGGCWWPAELFPPAMQTLARALPTSWAMQGFNGLVLRGLGLVEILPAAGVLLGFAVIFFAIGIQRFRWE